MTLSFQALDWAIEHLVRYCDTDIFPKLFEFDAIHHCWDTEKRWLAQQANQWCTRPFRRCLVPKYRYGFRVATQLDPLDMLVYTALIYEIGEDLERNRLPSNAQVVFSHRFMPDDSDYLFFDQNMNYKAFQEHSRELAEKYRFVAVTDIADFYPRIYLHRLENVLDSAAKGHSPHVNAIIRLIKSWNQNVSYGIPVGNNPSRLLAELVIDDVDRNLLSEGFVFCRYVDDYRIFCNSPEEAYKRLAGLANLLFESHGLTLQSQKTNVFPSHEFVAKVIETEERKELSALVENFSAIVSYLGLDNPYEEINYDELPDDVRKQIDGLNLGGLLQQQLDSDEIDIPMTKFLLNRLGQLKQTEPLRRVLKATDKLYSVFAEVIRYIARLIDTLNDQQRQRVGTHILSLLSGSVVSQIEFHRMLILSLFAGSNKWGNADRLAALYPSAPDDWCRRCLVLALGRSNHDFWFRARKTTVEQLSPWERRAFLAAASCLPSDERKHWYHTLKPRLDRLEQCVVQWASANPFRA